LSVFLLALVFLLAAGTSVGSGGAGPSVAKLAPSADSFVTAGRPTTNHGKEPRLVIARHPMSIAYLRFRLDVPPRTTVVRATLRLFITTATPSAFVIRDVPEATWREAGITFANAPHPGARVAVSPAGDGGAGYVTAVRGDCALWDVPMGSTSAGSFLTDLAGGALPTFAFVTPDLCSDTHDCPVATGDAWLQAWFAKILASPSYVAGDTVVFVVWDEDDGGSSNHIPLLVVSPSTRPATRSNVYLDHYSLLKTTEQLLGLGFLGQAGAATTASMAAAFNLG
jgi:hypothetical protein